MIFTRLISGIVLSFAGLKLADTNQLWVGVLGLLCLAIGLFLLPLELKRTTQ